MRQSVDSKCWWQGNSVSKKTDYVVVGKRQVLSWRLKVGNYLFIRSPTVGVAGISKYSTYTTV